MSNRVKYVLLDIAARLCAAVPPFLATMYFFPVWTKQSPHATLSGTVVAAFLICMVPFWKKIFDTAKNFSLTNASMPVFWLIIFGIFFALKEIVTQMIYISVWGIVGSLASAGLCALRNRYSEKKKEDITNE